MEGGALLCVVMIVKAPCLAELEIAATTSREERTDPKDAAVHTIIIEPDDAEILLQSKMSAPAGEDDFGKPVDGERQRALRPRQTNAERFRRKLFGSQLIRPPNHLGGCGQVTGAPPQAILCDRVHRVLPELAAT